LIFKGILILHKKNEVCLSVCACNDLNINVFLLSSYNVKSSPFYNINKDRFACYEYKYQMNAASFPKNQQI